MYLIGFPLLVVPFAIYNMIAFLTPGLSWTDAIASFTLVSGQLWTMTPQDLLLTLAVVLLPLEILKATRIGMRSIIDHILSLILFIAMLLEFLLVRQAGTSTFFILMVISIVDVICGLMVTLRTSQRDFTIEKLDGAI